MRVVAGRLGGRRLRAVPGTGTRPTADRVREALFGILGERIEGARVLDLYAGTGALSIEALSRGARSAVLVEQAPGAIAVIKHNLAALGLGAEAKVRRAKVERYLGAGEGDLADGRFGVVLADPPYDLPPDQISRMLELVVRRALAPGGTVVLEGATRAGAPAWPEGLEPAAPRRYGDSALHFATAVPG